ncbi:hypothetical protein BGX34_003138, partial [Mortierella sp. NVP85]
MTDDYHQGFRIVSASSSTPTGHSIVFVPSKPDKKTGERIILWRDIQREIKNADRIRNGNKSVVFMTDDDFEELIPQRILYHPGVILDVIVEAQEETVGLSSETLESSRALVRGSTQSMDKHTGADVASAVQQIANLSIATTDAVDKSLIIQSALLDKEDETPLQQHDQPN